MDSDTESEDENWQESLDEYTHNIKKENRLPCETTSGILKANKDNVEIGKIQSEVGHSHSIVHIDIDCYYAQVEMIRNPKLRDKPLGIQQKNIIVTCNYVARKYGVTKLMYLADALKKCPQLCVVKGEDLTHYRDMSYKITALLSKYSNTVERLGFDENFIDVTEMLQFPPWSTISEPPIEYVYGQDSETNNKEMSMCECGCRRRLTIASHIAADMRKSLYEDLGITSCAGVGYNKLLAKLVGETHKPNQQTVLFAPEVAQFMLALKSAGKIPGIGHKTCERLAGLEISSIQDLQTCSIDSLVTEFGEQTAKVLKDLSLGIDPTPVVNTGQPQSMSDEDSFRKCDTVEDAKAKMLELLQNLLKRLEVDGRIAQTLRISVRKIVPGVKYPNRQSRQGPIPMGTFSPFLQGNTQKTEKDLLDLSYKFFQKVVDTTQKFNLTLINICFANLVDSTSCQSHGGTIEAFFQSPKTKAVGELKDKAIDTLESSTVDKLKLNAINTSSSSAVCPERIKDSFVDRSKEVCTFQHQNTEEVDKFEKNLFSKQSEKKDKTVKTSNSTVLNVKPTYSKSVPSFFGQRLSNSNENVNQSGKCSETTFSACQGKTKHLKGEKSDSDITDIHLTGQSLDNKSSVNAVQGKVVNNDDTLSPVSINMSIYTDKRHNMNKTVANEDNPCSSSVNNDVYVDSNISNTVKKNTNVSPGNFRLLVKNLGSKIDINTFLELPQTVQQEIILQETNLNEGDQQQLLSIIMDSSEEGTNFVDEQISTDVISDNRACATLICTASTKETEPCVSDSYKAMTSSYNMQNSANEPSHSANNIPNSQNKQKISSSDKNANTNYTNTVSAPPGMDPEVFKELPKDVQKSLYNDWKTKSEFESMRKRKLNTSPDSNKGTGNKKRTSFSSIESFFRKK